LSKYRSGGLRPAANRGQGEIGRRSREDIMSDRNSIKSRRLTISDLLLTLAGCIALAFAVQMSAFSEPPGPDTEVKVVAFEPSGETDRQSNITIRFSNDLVSSDSLDQPVLQPPVRIKPAVAGIARWIETDVLRFYPDRELAPATEYEVTVGSREAFIDGNRISEPRTFGFHTPYLKITDVNYQTVPEKRRPGYVRLAINLHANYDVQPEDLTDHLEIRGSKNAAHSELFFEISRGTGPRRTVISRRSRQTADVAIWRSGGYQIQTEPFEVSTESQEYELVVEKGLTCAGCGTSLASDFRQALIIRKAEPLRVSRLDAFGAGAGFYILVDLSAHVAVEDVREYISLEPEVDFRIEGGRSRLILRGDFKPGETYTVNVAKGAPALDGTLLERDFSSRIQVPDLPPSVTFASVGAFLPREGSGNIELKTTNVDELVVEVEQVFENNLVYFLTGGYNTQYNNYTTDPNFLGRRIFFKEKELTYQKNEELRTTVDLGGIIGDTARGVFVVSARHKEQRWIRDSRPAMLTDIGISARLADDYLMVWVHSLDDTRPISRAGVTLISKNNQILIEGKTDSRGLVTFDHLKSATDGFEPYLVTVEKDGDLSYLLFADCLLPTSDFEVAGRPYLADGYEAFVYPDRGIYRPGDTAHLVSIVRGAGDETVKPFPYIVEVRDPRGREFKSYRVTAGERTMDAVDFEIPTFAPTGRYAVIARIGEDYIIGQTDIMVEEFMPDRIKVTATTSKYIYAAGDTIDIEAEAKFLFGPPAKGHRVSGSVTIESDLFKPSGWSKYSFTSEERKFSRKEIKLADTVLNDSGRFNYAAAVPEAPGAPSSLKGLIAVAVTETGGRTVGAYREITLHPYDRYLGMKLNLEGYADPGHPVTADVIALNAEGQPLAITQAVARFYRVVYNSVLGRNSQGYYRYVSERKLQLIDSAFVDIPAEGGVVEFTPADYGSYLIEIADGSQGHAATARFYASGWGYAPWSMAEPDRIKIDLDREKYTPGQTAKVQIRSPFAGTLLLTVERDRVIDMMTVQMSENTAEIDLPVKSDFFPNAYIVATLIRKAGEVREHAPARAFGMAPIMLENSEKALPLTIEAPSVVKPLTRVSLKLSTGLAGMRDITVALVDAGVLQLTDFETPDPLDFFYGKKRPHLNQYDMYSFVYPEVERAGSHLSPGGDRKFAEARKRHLNPITAQRVKPVSLWSGVVRTDDRGMATVTFDIPQFNGKLVALAVAAGGGRFGSASAETVVRDKIVIQESFPRFTAPNDIIAGLVSLFNNTGQAADVTVKLTLDGPAEFISDSIRTAHIANNAEGSVDFRFRAGLKPGRITCRLTAFSGADTARAEFELPNRPAQPLYTLYGSGVLTPDSAVTFTLPDEFLEGTDEYTLRTSSLAGVTFARNIQNLLSYPYGCLEQTTSRLFPLIYFNDLAKFVQPSLFGGGGPDYFIQEGILKLMSVEMSDGSFSYWAGQSDRHHWSSIYACHFLVEARRAGYVIEGAFYKRVLDNIRRIAQGRNYNDLDESQRIYAAYVLSLAGKMENRIINYLRKLNTVQLPVYSRYQLAATMAGVGEKELALSLLPADIQPNNFEPETGGNFNSAVRTDAILLDALMAIDPTNPSIPVLVQSLMEGARVGRWYTTQESAFALMALGKYFKDRPEDDFVGSLKVRGDSTYAIDTGSFFRQSKDLGGKEIEISIDGKGTCFYYWQASGVSTSHAVEEFDRGIIVRREYLTEAGEPIDPANVPLGTRVVARITAQARDKTLYNAVINDLIPAGFEIENPRLKTSPALSWIKDSRLKIDNVDIRDDRLLIFANLYHSNALEFYYSLRAVSAGEFQVPPIAAECMYNPLIAGAASSGRLTIIRQGGE